MGDPVLQIMNDQGQMTTNHQPIKREYPDSPIVAVGAFIVKDGKVLLVQRGHEPRKGLWTVPGGVVELGETLHEAIKREIMEETGLEIEVGEVVTVVDRITPGETGPRYHYVIIDYAAHWLAGEAGPLTDVDAVRWATPEEIDDPLIRSLAVKAIHLAYPTD